MKSKFLLPYGFRYPGWGLLMVSSILWFYLVLLEHGEFSWLHFDVFVISSASFLGERVFMDWITVNTSFTVIGVLFIVGGLLVSFSKERVEDEFLQRLRLEAMQWAFIGQYVILLLLFLLVYGMDFLQVMAYSMFLMMGLFILRFRFLVWRTKLVNDEKHD